MTTWALVALLLLLGAGIGWVAHDVFDVVRSTGRHADTDAPTPTDGELIHLDWGDARVVDDNQRAAG